MSFLLLIKLLCSFNQSFWLQLGVSCLIHSMLNAIEFEGEKTVYDVFRVSLFVDWAFVLHNISGMIDPFPRLLSRLVFSITSCRNSSFTKQSPSLFFFSFSLELLGSLIGTLSTRSHIKYLHHDTILILITYMTV